MRIQYRINKSEEVEIVRCFATDTKVVLPEQIAGYPVCSVAAYAFSVRKAKEEEDVLVYETDGGLFGAEAHLLAGNDIESVVFPNTVEQIGNYIFYGCKSLRELEFSDTLVQIGSGAFTGCGQLAVLRVHLQNGEKSCVKEILGDLWQRMDVTFYYDGTGRGKDIYEELGYENAGCKKAIRAVNLVFPEHYEEAVENTPARILFTQHHGTGNNYRQCFYNREMDFRKYDELFPLAIAQDKPEVLADMVFDRLESAYELTEVHEKMYEDYVRKNLPEIVDYLVKQENLKRLHLISERRLWSEAGLDEAIRTAAEEDRPEMLSFLMNEKHLLFPQKKKKFEL